MKKRVVLTALIALALLGALFGYKFMKIRRAMAAQAGMAPPPAAVSTIVAESVTWPNTFKAVGTLASFRGVTIKAELEGVVRRVHAESGSVVEQGALLVEMDDSVEAASLPGLEAQARLADINLKRAQDLRTNGTNTASELDTAEAMAAQSKAAVAQLRATLAKKRITAPFAGRLGITQVYPGQFLSKGAEVVQLESLDKIHVDFSLPQQDVPRVAAGVPVKVVIDAFPETVFDGQITSTNPHLNEKTRTLEVRATLANPGEILRPGMFGQVEVVLPSSENYVALPTAAIVYNPYGNVVFVVEKGIATQRFVQVGPTQGSRVAVLSGLKAGETVVTSGQIKLRNGSPVQVNNTVTPSANPNPKPNQS